MSPVFTVGNDETRLKIVPSTITLNTNPTRQRTVKLLKAVSVAEADWFDDEDIRLLLVCAAREIEDVFGRIQIFRAL